MEDLDIPRCAFGAADGILRTLEAFGLHSDEPVIYQSQRTSAYEAALQHLKDVGAAYPCCCTRKEITDSAVHGIEGPVYPGTCRNGIPQGKEARAWRVRTDISLPAGHGPDETTSHSTRPASGQVAGYVKGRTSFGKVSPGGPIEFADALQGHITQHLESEIGDFVVKRADGLFAYQLAVVVDDAFQNITHVVRGADLLASTPRQIHLQRLLGVPTPCYMHLPVAVNEVGEKLSKQTLAAPVGASRPAATLVSILNFLQQQPPPDLVDGTARTVLDWAIKNWDATRLREIHTLPAQT